MSVQRSAHRVFFYSSLTFVLLALVGADLIYFGRLESALPEPVAAQVPAPSIVTDPTRQVQECEYDAGRPSVAAVEDLVTPRDPFRGDPNADVVVVEYFDPNCPHCRTMYPIMEVVEERFADRVKFVYKPVIILGRHSVAQVAALHAAAEEGKFFEMLELQFANQDPRRGLSLDQLRAIAEEVGMSPDDMERRLRSNRYAPVMQQQNEQFVAISGDRVAVPAVLINGRFVAGASRTVDCLSELIAAELENVEG